MRCIIFCPSTLAVPAPVRLIVGIMVLIKAVVRLIGGFVRRFRSLCCVVKSSVPHSGVTVWWSARLMALQS